MVVTVAVGVCEGRDGTCSSGCVSGVSKGVCVALSIASKPSPVSCLLTR